MTLWLNQIAWHCLAQVDGKAGGEQPGLLDVVSRLALPIGAIIVLYVFLMVIPNRREQKKMEEFLAGIKKNDTVILQGGIVGTVINAQKDSKFVSVRIDETTNAKMKVLRSAIVRVMTDADDAPAEKS